MLRSLIKSGSNEAQRKQGQPSQAALAVNCYALGPLEDYELLPPEANPLAGPESDSRAGPEGWIPPKWEVFKVIL
jgi:hypothetical protein